MSIDCGNCRRNKVCKYAYIASHIEEYIPHIFNVYCAVYRSKNSVKDIEIAPVLRQYNKETYIVDKNSSRKDVRL